mmetsp:Transcript_9707/g.27259  ORF Transcript_9707/g.27259 Transcript_9707/m.27259 type:complete len:448 (+) Transcript_9707:189-1532(+)
MVEADVAQRADIGSTGEGADSIPNVYDYITSWIALELYIVWYFAFSFRFVSRAVRVFVKKGFGGFVKLMENSEKPEVGRKSLSAEERTVKSEGKKFQIPAKDVLVRMGLLLDLLFFPYFLVSIPHIGPDYSLFQWLADVILMCIFMIVPTFFVTVYFPSTMELDIINDVGFVLSLWLPWEFRWLPDVPCDLSRDNSFPVSHLVMLCLVLFLVHIPSRLHHRIGFVFENTFSKDNILISITGLSFCLVVVVPIGILMNFFVLGLDGSLHLFEYVGNFFLQYFIYAMVQEIFFRGIMQNMIEFRLNRRNPPPEEAKEAAIRLQALSPLTDVEQPHTADMFLSDLDEIPEGPVSAPSATQQIKDFLNLPSKNAWVALGVTSTLNGIAFLFVDGEGGSFPNFSYFVVAFLAALAYGWVWRKTTRVTVSAVTHAIFAFLWFSLFCNCADPSE